MELISLHPFDQQLANRWVASLDRATLAAVADGDARAQNHVTLGLARAMAERYPVFVLEGFGLTTWEAMIDRGIGMMMRPISRALVDAGLSRDVVADLPIRLEPQASMMGGAYIPSRLIGEASSMLDERFDRLAKRIHDAEMDPYAVLGFARIALAYANEHGLGLYEAIDAVQPGDDVIPAPEKQDLPEDIQQRITTAITPPKKPGLFGRLFGR